MNMLKPATFLLVGVGLMVVGCGSGGKTAAVVNGQVITEQEVTQRMAGLNPSYRTALGNDRKKLLEEMIMETVLLQEARRRGLDRDSQVKQLLKEAKRQILLGRLLEVLRDSKQVEVTDEEVRRIYEANKDSFKEPETFRASHVLAENEETAKKVLERLKAGESFAKLAEEVSKDVSKAKGGDIGYFSKGQLIPEFEAACEPLKPGELSGVVKTSLGYHVILLTERKAARVRPLEEVRDQIRKQLAAQQQQRQIETYVQQLRAKAQIQFRDSAVSPKQVPKQATAPSQPTNS